MEVSRRTRGIYSKNACLRCRERKKKCDGSTPCGQCVKAGAETAASCKIVLKSKTRRGRILSRKMKNKEVASQPATHRSPLILTRDEDDECVTSAFERTESDDIELSVCGDAVSGALRQSYVRRELLTVYADLVSPLVAPSTGLLSTIHKDIQREYESGWWDGDTEESNRLCNSAYVALALNVTGRANIGAQVMLETGNAILSRKTMPSLPVILSALNVAAHYLSYKPEKARLYAEFAQRSLPYIGDMDERSKQMSGWMIKHYLTQTNSNMSLIEKATVYVIGYMDENTADMHTTRLAKVNMLTLDPLETPSETGKLISSVDVDHMISSLRGSINTILNKLLVCTQGSIIFYVDEMMRVVSGSEAVKQYGILHSNSPSVSAHPALSPEAVNIVNDMFPALGSYLRLLQGIRNVANLDIRVLKRWTAAVQQLSYTCRCLTFICLHLIGQTSLALECAQDFADKCSTYDFSMGSVGSYVLPLSMLINYAVDVNDIKLLDTAIEHASLLEKSIVIHPDQRRQELHTVARLLKQTLVGGQGPDSL